MTSGFYSGNGDNRRGYNRYIPNLAGCRNPSNRNSDVYGGGRISDDDRALGTITACTDVIVTRTRTTTATTVGSTRAARTTTSIGCIAVATTATTTAA